MVSELLTFVIDNQLKVETLHNPIKLIVVKFVVALVHRNSLHDDDDLLFKRLDFFDSHVVFKVKV